MIRFADDKVRQKMKKYLQRRLRKMIEGRWGDPMHSQVKVTNRVNG